MALRGRDEQITSEVIRLSATPARGRRAHPLLPSPPAGTPFPTVFSSCSKKDLAASLEKGVGMCLFNVPEVKVLYGGQKCGNGYVEEGEECDCGELEECMNPCCNATTCTLKGDAVCAHGQCCEDCKLKAAGTPCRESSNSCDLPEFCTGANPHCPANVYLHDGHACHNVDGYCYNGICQTHEQQCITLWGQGAKPAPGICFERVNSAGDPYGNCGKDSKGSFMKCDARDAKCGKIQCQGGANRPVIGTNAVSIETNIPLQEGGRVLCRGTHVYLGDDMPDPGLVLTGTKCGEGMMCMNRRCQNVSMFGVHECSGRCNGRGVCNNKKNCHCEAHWGPPFCDQSGFGGSVDSGPMRQADGRSVVVGILVVLLGVLAAGLIVCLKRKALVRLLFTNKKTAIEKLRSVGSNGPSSPTQTQSGNRPSPPRQPLTQPQSASICKMRAEPDNRFLSVANQSSADWRRIPLERDLNPAQVMQNGSGRVGGNGSDRVENMGVEEALELECVTQSGSAIGANGWGRGQKLGRLIRLTWVPSPSSPRTASTPRACAGSPSTSTSTSATPSPCPPAPPPHRGPPSHGPSPPRGAPLRNLPRHSSFRLDMELEKPSPPQKPLPADPLARTSRLGRSSSAVGSPKPVPVPLPGIPRPAPPVPHSARPSSRQPPTLPKPRILPDGRYRS
ncbi:hypothetical protein SKAU_G00143560 [Synaphobranchus kaupii]|uniref:Disintegrin and metalloproteinase domain-containing protein 12 n=1 Tax=Synaphobranchus kaupii TaxID=118154 RepID=A0A9Q1J4M5_SYNKA|nr:hypothetical protein SKAU_G00143560 [Synaphobranchus kaupii]